VLLCIPHGAAQPTFKQEGLVPVGVEVLPLDLGLQLVLLVRQQIELDEGVGRAGEVLGRKVLTFEDFDGEGRVLEAVPHAELDPAQLLADRNLVVVLFRTRGELRRGKRSAGTCKVISVVYF